MADDVTLSGLTAKLNGLMFEPFIRSTEAMVGMVQVSTRLGQAMADAAIGSLEAARRLLESLEKSSRELQKAPLDIMGAFAELGTANARLLVRTAEAVQGAIAGRSASPLPEPLAGAPTGRR